MASTSGQDTSPDRRTHIIRTILAVAVIAPLAIAAFYMWALWNPGDTVNQLPVAIVNADAGTDLDGTRLEAGTEVVTALVDSGDVAWKVVSAQEAKDGVDDGRFYFSVVIPENFSADVASAATGSGRKAQLQVVYNDYNSLVATPSAKVSSRKFVPLFSESIGEQSIDQVLVGLGDLGAGFGEAATGARELDAGMQQLLSGTDELGAGAGQISEVVDMVTTPILDLVGTSGAVIGQIDALTNTLRLAGDPVSAALVTELSNLRASLTAPTDDDLIGQLGQLRGGARAITRQLTDPTSDYRGGLNAASAGAGTLSAGLGQLSDGAYQLDSGADELSTGLGQLAAGSIDLRDGLSELNVGVGELNIGSDELARGFADGAAQVPQFTDKERAATANLLAAPVALTLETTIRPPDSARAQYPLSFPSLCSSAEFSRGSWSARAADARSRYTAH